MPTHRDHPWGERVAEAPRSGPPAAARQWAWALLVIAGVLAVAAGRGGPPHAPSSPPAPKPPAPLDRLGVQAVRSRALGGRRVLVWGSASSPVRASIGLRVRVAGVRIRAPRRVPLARDGLFEVVVRIPRRLAGRPVDVEADMYVGGARTAAPGGAGRG